MASDDYDFIDITSNYDDNSSVPYYNATNIPPPRPPENYDYAYYVDSVESVATPWTEDKAFWPTAVTYGLTFTLGLVGNILVIFALVLDRKCRNVTSFFQISLAVADLVFLLVCIPYETLMKMNTSWAGGSALCKTASFVDMLSACATVLNLVAVSIERYIVIVHPLKSRSWCTVSNAKKTIVSMWITATLLSAPILHIMDTNKNLFYSKDGYAVTVLCSEHNVSGRHDRLVFVYYQLLILFLLPVLIMAYCYSVVVYVLWLSTRELAKMSSVQQSTNGDTRRGRSEQHDRSLLRSQAEVPRVVKEHNMDAREARKQVIKMLLAIIAVFFLCWGPKLVLLVLKRHELSILYKDTAFFASLVINLLPYIHSCANPIIYCFMSHNFRRSMRNGCSLCCSCCCRQCVCRNSHGPRSVRNGQARYWSPATSRRTARTSANTATSIVMDTLPPQIHQK